MGSTVEPPITLQTKLRADGTLIVMDGSGQELSLGTAVYDPLDNLAQAYTVAIDPGDQAVFQVSRSVIPYYYGWRIFSPAPLFRYFRYYSLSIRQANGANLKVEWKFTTYRTPDGSWTPDAYGWRGEGLVRLELQMAK